MCCSAWRRYRTSLVVAVACAMVVGSLSGADEPAGNGLDEVPAEVVARRLVQQLGADEYREREAAAKRLLALGLGARDALSEGLKSPELEIRLRARALLRAISHSGFESRLRAFIAGEPGAEAPPGWSKFKSITGDSPAARSLYAEMFRSDGRLLAAFASESPTQDSIQLLQKRISDVRTEQMESMRTGRINLKPETIALLLYLTNAKCIPDATKAYPPILSLYSLLIYPGSESSIRDPLVLKLLDDWAVHRSTGPAAYYVIEICNKFERRKAGLELAKKILLDSNAQPNAIPLAAMIIAAQGDVEDVPLLEKYLSNSVRFTTHHNLQIRKEPIPIEVRDIVLAMLIHMTGQKIEDYGYKHARPDAKTIYNRYSLLFLSDEERQAALNKWKAWRAAHPKLVSKN